MKKQALLGYLEWKHILGVRTLDNIIKSKKLALIGTINESLSQVAEKCIALIDNKPEIERLLDHCVNAIPHANAVYLLNTHGAKISCGLVSAGVDDAAASSDIFNGSQRICEGNESILVSRVYVKKNKGPSLSCFKELNDNSGLIGYLACDFNVADIPSHPESHRGQIASRQFKGDPAIRSTLFMQTRHESAMDKNIDAAMKSIEMLMRDHGVFLSRIHFSSARFTAWTIDNPFDYHLHGVDDIINPDVSLAYPKRAYPDSAKVSQDKISAVFEHFKSLREADDNVYLRVASLNIMNGMVELTFSCDGSHYMPVDEFLDKDLQFWYGDSWVKQKSKKESFPEQGKSCRVAAYDSEELSF